MNVVERTCELVRFPTHHPWTGGGGGDELAMCRHLATLLQAHRPDEIEVVETGRKHGGPGGFVYARWGTPRLLFNVHVDTVPPNTGWTQDPWTPSVANGGITGLGACDTKGAIAAILCAFERKRPENVAVLFSGDEERGTAAVTSFLRSPRIEGIELAIVCEPTSRRAGVRHRGVIAGAATVRGAGGHSSNADRMPAPLVTIARLAVALHDVGRAELDAGPPDMKGLCLNIAGIDGGVAFNVVPETATLTYSIRPAPGFDRAAWDARVAALAAAIDPGIALEVRTNHMPFACSNEPRARALLGDRVTAYAPLDFWTEAALHEAAGVPAVVVGPGEIHRAHAPDEWVSIDDLDWAVETFAALL